MATHRTPDCPGNNPGTGRIETCANATLSCPQPMVRMRLWSAPPGTQVGSGSWTSGPSVCSPPATPAVPVLTAEDFRRLPLPAQPTRIEPAGGTVLVGRPTNVYVSSRETVELSTTLLGQDVRVRAQPVGWTFDYGDGDVRGPLSDPGGPYPRLSTAHSYRDPGTYTIRVTTLYDGTYSVAGGPWQDVDGQARVTAEAVTVTARAADPQLIAG